MENYQHFYYSLFNDISDIISQAQKKQYSSEEIIENLKNIQINAETRFLEASEEEYPENNI